MCIVCLQNELKGERGDSGVKGEKGEPGGFYDPRFASIGGQPGPAGNPGPPVRTMAMFFFLRFNNKMAKIFDVQLLSKVLIKTN